MLLFKKKKNQVYTDKQTNKQKIKINNNKSCSIGLFLFILYVALLYVLFFIMCGG